VLIDSRQTDLRPEIALDLVSIEGLAAVYIYADAVALSEGVDGYVALIDDDETGPPWVAGIALHDDWASDYLHTYPSGELAEDGVN
jgi:hypothetical protein